MSTAVTLLFLTMAGLLIVIGVYASMYDDLNSNYYHLQKDFEYLREKYDATNKKNSVLYANQYHYNSKIEMYRNTAKELAKELMKKTHPDNGGSQEEFEKYRDLYEKLKTSVYYVDL